jgi:hypothetical protein
MAGTAVDGAESDGVCGAMDEVAGVAAGVQMGGAASAFSWVGKASEVGIDPGARVTAISGAAHFGAAHVADRWNEVTTKT